MMADAKEENMGEYIAKWHRELGIFCRIKPLIIVEGNVLDVYQYPVEGSTPKGSILRLPEYLHYYFTDLGYKTIAFFDSMQGFYNSCEEGHIQAFAELTHAKLDGDYIRSDFKGKANSATSLVRAAVNQNKQPVAIVMNLASRYITSPDNIDQSEVDSFTNLLLASMEGKDVRTQDGTLKNLVVMIVNKVNDVPAWFYLDNPNVKTVSIGTPSKEEREWLVKGENFASFFAADVFDEDYPFFEEHPDELEKVQDRFVGLTEGFSFTEINGLRRLCKNEKTRIRQMSTVIDLYRYGIKENPWDTLDVNELKTAKEDFQKRVKGQDFAIVKTLDVVKRAVTGMAGLQSSSHAKPKGILFFAGPTGTGKTETAKTLAEKLFGDESCCIRFDMSEYSQSHSDQKLLGAPPGYVGYEAGGQGNTVYFSECIIIFTSNLGIYTRNEMGVREPNVTPDMDYPEVQKKVRQAIEDYFKLELGRPEILNRIGENIVVFDFIRPEVAKQILDAQVTKIVKNLAAEKGIELVITEKAKSVLVTKALGNLGNGGRGIGNIIESLLINPLARYMFDEEIKSNVRITLNDIDAENMPYAISCECEVI